MINPEPTIKFTDAASNKDGPEKTSATFDELMRVHISIDDIYTGMLFLISNWCFNFTSAADGVARTMKKLRTLKGYYWNKQ